MKDLEVKIENWKKRLLDLGKRNRLINFKETKRSNVTIVTPSYDILYEKIVHEEDNLKFTYPLKTTYDENGEEININVEKGDLETNKTLNEQQKTLKVLRGRAKSSIEEQGINTLYLTFGIIRWKESEASDVIISSPLVLVPVMLTIESITEPYVLQLHEDEIVVNPSLAFKFENDFGILLPEFDGHEDEITEYLFKINEIAKKNDWDVVNDVHLTLLSFLKINMYKDLDNNKDRIVSNPIIKSLSGDKSEITLIPSELNNFNHDKNIRPIDTYQVVDADSSQQDAILLSKKGVSFVLQGPPGTGKSQTITNIIAESISDGKKVLFVSEKMAALEVVKKRLTESGLDDFCLTLHSNKANKKEILNQLAKTLNKDKISLHEDALYQLSVLEEKRSKINEYQEQLHEKCLPLNISIYEANGRLAKLSDTQDFIFDISNIENTDTELLNKYKYLLSEFSKTIGKLKEDYSNNPWYGSNVLVVTHELRHDIEVNLNILPSKLKDLIHTYDTIIKITGGNIPITFNNIYTLINLLEFSSKSIRIPKKWLTKDLSILISCAEEYSKIFYEYNEYIGNLFERYEKDVLNLNASDIMLDIESNIISVKPYLNNTNFTNNKEIISKADLIISECKVIRIFIEGIYNQSKSICSILGLEQKKSLGLIIQIKSLLELILKNPKPMEKWFNNDSIQYIKNLIQIAKDEQLILNDNLKKISVNYKDNILNVEYDKILERFNKVYSYELNIISDFNNLSNYLELNEKLIVSFVDNEVEKLKEFYLLITDALKASNKIIEQIGIKKPQSLEELIYLFELISAIAQNPRPTLAWFDEDKEFVINKIICDIKNIQKEIEEETNEILKEYTKDIFSIDYKNMLIRFNTDYTNVLKILKSSYFIDKKIIKGYSKNPQNKISDIDIMDLLGKITRVKEKEQWLLDNKPLATEMLGDLYGDNYTNWDIIDKCRKNFKIINDYFGINKIPKQLKRLLIENDTEELILSYSTIIKLIECNVLDFLESVFGVGVGKQQLLELLQKMQNTINISNELLIDYQNIMKYYISTNIKGTITISDIIEIIASVKIVNQKRLWFSDNSTMLSDNIGGHYDGEDTDWENVSNQVNIVEQIMIYFGENPVPSRLITYLLSSQESQDCFSNLISEINDTEQMEIVTRLDDLLNIQDIENTNIKSLIQELIFIENGVNTSYSKYMDFTQYAKCQMQFESIMSDISALNKIQEIKKQVNSNLYQLESKFDFAFEGMNTNWNKVLSSLGYAVKLYEMSNKYELSNEYVEELCSDNGISEWAIKYSEKLKGQIEDLKNYFDWFVNLFDNSEDFYSSSIYKILDKIEKSIDNLYLLEEWIDFRSIRQQCREAGLSEFIEKVEQTCMPPKIIVDTFFKRFYRLWLDIMIPKFPAVYSFRGRSHKSMINEFNRLDKYQLEIARLRILERLISCLPDTNIATSSFDEVGILIRELNKQRKIMPLRRLFKEIPNLLTSLKPCLMMSPLSVSLFLQADGYNFDTVIFDEASQVCTEDAIGAIMRGKQVIIAGDSKQLPPTSFFAATLSDGDFDTDDDAFDDEGAYDSILEEAVNAMPERTLKWHYRSRHEHLIAFSNSKIYNNELITFPSNMDKVPDNGVEYIYVENGIYDRGGKKHNLNEAKQVATLVFENMRKYPKRSLGVVTFSEAQQQAVDNAVRELRLQNSQYEKLFSEDIEQPFFIKNLENVQGDERDTIIFSIGYAKDQNGVMYMNFGPLSRNGGHRRLNVAITRAKYNVKLVGSIHPTDIDIDKTNSDGVKMLRQYIEFSINGASVLQNELNFNNIVNVDSPFEEAVHDFLIKNGYKVTTQVGCSGYRIDMAIKHPTLSGIFVLGIECDGATYHSARTARERDRLRQTVLEDIGWKIYRIWSTDWIKDPKTEGNKLLEAVERAVCNYKIDGLSIKSKKDDITNTKCTLPYKESYVTVQKMEETGDCNNNPYNFSFYKETDINIIARKSNDNEYFANVIDYVVEQEGPIHYELLCKRVATLFGNQKATVKVRKSVEHILNNYLDNIVDKKGDFCWHKKVNKIKVKIPLNNGDSRAINFISIEELAEAMFVIVGKSYGITPNDLYMLTARLFGFNRTGTIIMQAMEKACLYLLNNNKVKNVDGKIIV